MRKIGKTRRAKHPGTEPFTATRATKRQHWVHRQVLREWGKGPRKLQQRLVRATMFRKER